MSNKITIAVDAMGGDNAPDEIIKGAILSLSNEKINILLVGKEDLILNELNKHNYDKTRIKVLNASQIISADEIPTSAIKEKKDSSIVVGLRALKEKKADAFVSAGNTGALLTGAAVIIGRIKGIERPALAALLPNEKDFTLFLDCGANVDCKPDYLVQFAQMGSVYMENILKINKPKVGLLNVGVESEKGNLLTKEAFQLLSNSNVNFIGNVEARELPRGVANIIICDGFVGNIVLKYTEGVSKYILSLIKKELLSTIISRIGAFICKPAFSNLKKSFDYSEIGGAPFLGLKSLVVKAHGNSDNKSIRGAIFQCVAFVENDTISKLEQKLQLY